MAKTAKVTRIEKKYKDKKTGEMRSMTIDYSKVKDRLIEFRTDCPRGSIVTSYSLLTDRIIFKAHIVKDKGDVASAEATGHATGKDDGTEKIFEKLETIATGRALALLGYGATGEIASSEEMEEFEAHKKQMHEEAILAFTERVGDAQSIDELKDIWATVPAVYHDELKPVFAKRKELINEKDQSKTK